MGHTSFSQMLVYSFANVNPFWKSAGFVLLALGVLMAIGALAGLRTLTVLAALLALAAAGMWIGLIEHHYNTPNQPNAHYLNPANLPWSDLRAGAWLTIAGAVLALLSAFLLRRRIREPASEAVTTGRDRLD
jgi:LPXTG-motif cell wall-anchored protein